MSQTPESKVKSEISKYLTSLEMAGLPIYYEARPAGGLTFKKGMPDIWMIYNGIHIEIEIKKPGGKMSIMQKKQRRRLQKSNCLVYCVESKEEVEEIIKKIDS